MTSKFEGKTKADLVAIARISGLLKTTISQKMSKAELLEFLEEADRKNEIPQEVDIKAHSNTHKSTKPPHKLEKEKSKIETKPESQSDSFKKREEEADKSKSSKLAKTSQSRFSNKRKPGRKGSYKKDADPASCELKNKYNGKPNEELDDAPYKERVENEETSPYNDKEIYGGILEIMPDGYGFIRIENYIQSPNDLYLPPQYIRRFQLRNGDYVCGPCRQQRDNDRYPALYYLTEVNGQNPDNMLHRPHFDRLTPIYPDERYTLETSRSEISTRIIDLVSPIGKGQRGMIVSPPKAGKTVLLKKIANAISENNPDTRLFVLLIDERPEEVTDMERSIKGEVVYSTFDKSPENHVKITELVLERAKRLVELGEDVVILLDSITRMSRAYNLTINPTGRTLSGGLDPGALHGPKRFFGAARNIEHSGSLTIIATALVETGSRMDEVIFEEFKGTGNMEVYLDRKLAEKRIFPAIDVVKSGTRREDLLLSEKELDAVWGIRKAFGHLETNTVTESVIGLMLKTKDNDQFVDSINVSINDKQIFPHTRNNNLNGRSASNDKSYVGTSSSNGSTPGANSGSSSNAVSSTNGNGGYLR